MTFFPRIYRPDGSATKTGIELAIETLQTAKAANGAMYAPTSLTAADDQELPDLLNPAADPAVLGSTTGVDVNDPRVLPHTAGEDYVRMPAVVGNAIGVTSDPAWSTGYDTNVSRVRCRIPTTISTGRIATVRNQGWLRINSGGTITAQYRIGPGEFSDPVGTVAVPWAANQLVDVAFVIDVGNQQVEAYWRSAPSTSLLDDAIADFTGWTKFIDEDTSGEPIDPSQASTATWIGSNGTTNLQLEGDFLEAQLAQDGVVVEWTPSATNYTISRSATGLKTALVTRPVLLTDGTDDYGQLPASATPTFTKIAGKHTGLVLLRDWQDNNFGRVYSSESGSDNGISIQIDNTGVFVYCGDGATTVSRTLPRPADGVLFVAAFVVNEGQLALYTSEDGLSTDIALSGITGTITHGTPRLMSLGYAAAGPAIEFLSFIDAPGQAPTLPELDALSEYLKAGAYL